MAYNPVGSKAASQGSTSPDVVENFSNYRLTYQADYKLDIAARIRETLKKLRRAIQNKIRGMPTKGAARQFEITSDPKLV